MVRNLEVFSKTYESPSTTESHPLRENLKIAKNILEEEGWKINNGKLMKNQEKFVFEFLIVSPSLEKLALAFQKMK